ARPIPGLEGRGQAAAHAGGEVDACGQVLGELASCPDTFAGLLGPASHHSRDQACPANWTLTTPNLGHYLRRELRLRSAQHRRDRRANRDVIATDHRGELVSVRGAAEESEQSDVIDLGQLLVAKAEPLTERSREEARPQRLLNGLAH